MRRQNVYAMKGVIGLVGECIKAALANPERFGQVSQGV